MLCKIVCSMMICFHTLTEYNKCDANKWINETEYNAVCWHYIDIIMGAVASQITSVSILCSTVVSGADQRNHQSSASLAFVRGIHRWPVNSPHKRSVTRKMFPFYDVIMNSHIIHIIDIYLMISCLYVFATSCMHSQSTVAVKFVDLLFICVIDTAE